LAADHPSVYLCDNVDLGLLEQTCSPRTRKWDSLSSEFFDERWSMMCVQSDKAQLRPYIDNREREAPDCLGDDLRFSVLCIGRPAVDAWMRCRANSIHRLGEARVQWCSQRDSLHQ